MITYANYKSNHAAPTTQGDVGNTGKYRVDYDHISQYQCVDEILEWCAENGIPTGVHGNAIDYAERPTKAFTDNFMDVTIQTRLPGDVVVLRGLAGNPYGHIALFDHAPYYILEQNMVGTGTGLGRDAIGVYRSIDSSRIMRVWRLKAPVPIPPSPAARATVFLPSSAGPWHLYNYGSSYNPNDSRAVKGILRPDLFPPGLTYKIEAWVSDYAAVIQTQSFGRGVVWLKGTSAVVS